jgi:hypothetical protein
MEHVEGEQGEGVGTDREGEMARGGQRAKNARGIVQRVTTVCSLRWMVTMARSARGMVMPTDASEMKYDLTALTPSMAQ